MFTSLCLSSDFVADLLYDKIYVTEFILNMSIQIERFSQATTNLRSLELRTNCHKSATPTTIINHNNM